MPQNVHITIVLDYNLLSSHVTSTTRYDWTKDVGMAICKSIVVVFLPCLVAFLGFHPYMLLHFSNNALLASLYSVSNYNVLMYYGSHVQTSGTCSFVIVSTCTCIVTLSGVFYTEIVYSSSCFLLCRSPHTLVCGSHGGNQSYACSCVI